MNILELFPVPVGQVELDRSLTENELKFIDEIRSYDMMSNSQPDTGERLNGFSDNQYVLDNESLKELKNDLQTFVTEYFNKVWCPKGDVEIYITTSWITWTEKHESHHEHAHPNSVVSGTFYISGGPNDSIHFKNDRTSRFFTPFHIVEKEVNMYNCASYVENTRSNQLKMWPSHLTHRVSPKIDDFPRICLAFNTWLRGTIGDRDTATELKLP